MRPISTLRNSFPFSFKGKIKKFDSDNYDKEHFISDEMGEDVNGGKYESK